jgi:hypothetical protein
MEPIMIEIPVKEVWNALTSAEKEDACQVFLEGKDTFSRDALPRVTRELAGAMKFREPFLKRLPIQEKVRHLRRLVDSPTLRHLCDDLLRSWLVCRKTPMLVCFVEAQGLKHVNGIIDDSVTQADLKSVTKGVCAVVAAFPPREVALYMGIMLAAGGDFWVGLAEAVEKEFPGMKTALSQ